MSTTSIGVLISDNDEKPFDHVPFQLLDELELQCALYPLKALKPCMQLALNYYLVPLQPKFLALTLDQYRF